MKQELSNTTLRDYARILFRQKGIFLAVVATVTVVLGVGLKWMTPVYEAQTKVLVSAEKPVESEYYRENARDTDIAATQGEIVKSNPVIERTVRTLHLDERRPDYEARFSSVFKVPVIEFLAALQDENLKKLPPASRKPFLIRAAAEDLKSRIRVDPIQDTNTFTIRVQDYDPVEAATIANTLSRAYLIYNLEQQLIEAQMRYGEKHPVVMQLTDNIAALEQTLHGQPVPTLDAQGTSSSKIVEQAEVPLKPAGIKKIEIFSLGLAMAAFFALALAFLCDYLDHTFKTPREINTLLDLPFLGAFPKKESLRPHALRDLADEIYLLIKKKKLKSLMVCSVDPSGNSAPITLSVAKELAARFGKKVLMIDADFRHPMRNRVPKGWSSETKWLDASFEPKLLPTDAEPRLPQVRDAFGVHNSPLSEILEGTAILDLVPETVPQLLFLSAGKTGTHPFTLIDSETMKEILNKAREVFDVVFVKAPALNVARENEVLASMVDGTIVIVTEGKTRHVVAQATIENLLNGNPTCLGAILNSRTFVIPKMVYDRI